MHWKTYEHSQHRIIDHLCAQSERDIVMLLARSGNEKGLVEIFKHYKRDMDWKAILAKIEERHSVNGNMTRSNKVCDSMQQLVQLFSVKFVKTHNLGKYPLTQCTIINSVHVT